MLGLEAIFQEPGLILTNNDSEYFNDEGLHHILQEVMKQHGLQIQVVYEYSSQGQESYPFYGGGAVLVRPDEVLFVTTLDLVEILGEIKTCGPCFPNDKVRHAQSEQSHKLRLHKIAGRLEEMALRGFRKASQAVAVAACPFGIGEEILLPKKYQIQKGRVDRISYCEDGDRLYQLKVSPLVNGRPAKNPIYLRHLSTTEALNKKQGITLEEAPRVL